MANNYFQFKQFTVQQQHCAMKVCTDACIFGAYISTQIMNSKLLTEKILDIGTGTGLLALMLAQKTSALIDGIEIDEPAFEQARYNFEQSPWAHRLKVFNTDALLYHPAGKYDFILCNPPFFEGDLKSANKKKNAAKHDTTLTLEQLLTVIDLHLSPGGSFAVLLPARRANFFIELADTAHYFLNEQLIVQHTNEHPFFRSIVVFSHHKTAVIRNELVIKKADGNYTPAFNLLMEDYYL